MLEPIGSIKPLRLFIIHYCKHKGDYDDFSLLVTFNFSNHKDAFCGLEIYLIRTGSKGLKKIDLCNSLAKNYTVLTLKFAQIGGGFAVQIQISENCKTEVF